MSVSHSEIRPLRPTQEVILEAACELMASHGFGGMSIRALAQQVGIHPGSIYNYFSCK
ncbi:TetR/AcrR family transcriptional regulator [Pseudomonas sp. Y24-6]|uniref:TetR/AcrR family transcriptional regulator n=1 Tax=Pseudomonas sp. Y24-6 TaxID=2750013 RepID=UPI001CE1B775|nr:TetR/AcrR family transcriptional regulator [Pseudomonas sp. Y24-6]